MAKARIPKTHKIEIVARGALLSGFLAMRNEVRALGESQYSPDKLDRFDSYQWLCLIRAARKAIKENIDESGKWYAYRLDVDEILCSVMYAFLYDIPIDEMHPLSVGGSPWFELSLVVRQEHIISYKDEDHLTAQYRLLKNWHIK